MSSSLLSDFGATHAHSERSAAASNQVLSYSVARSLSGAFLRFNRVELTCTLRSADASAPTRATEQTHGLHGLVRRQRALW